MLSPLAAGAQDGGPQAGGETAFQCELCGLKITKIIYFNSHTRRRQQSPTPEATACTPSSQPWLNACAEIKRL